MDSNEILRGRLKRNSPNRGPVTNVVNSLEEFYRRNAIVGGSKIIYIEIYGVCGGSDGVGA